MSCLQLRICGLAALATVALLPSMAIAQNPVLTGANCSSDLLTVIPGDIPVIITAPHAGDSDLGIPGVSARDCTACVQCQATGAVSFTVGAVTRDCASCNICNTGRDVRTAAVTDGIVAEVQRLTGGQPYVVMAHFDRKFLDTNRPDTWAALEDPTNAGPCYDTYHGAIRLFVDEIRRKHNNRGLLVDVHGQGIYRCNGGVQDGLQCTPSPTACGTGDCTDQTLRNSICRGTRDGLTVTGLRAEHGDEAVTGPRSVMGQIEALGWPIYPPNGMIGAPAEGTASGCFNGGHTTVTYGSQQPDGIDAIQLEFGRNLRDGGNTQASVSTDVGRAIATFYEAFLSEAISQEDAGAREETGDRYGDALAMGDFDGDGIEDLAVGVPGEDDLAANEGMVVVHYGGGDRVERLVQRNAGALGESGDGFGTSLAAGDFDGDGFVDLAVGVPAENDRAVDDGMVIAFYGSAQGFLSGASARTRVERLNQVHAGAQSEAYDRFGTTLTVGDFDDDGRDDLAVGVPNETISASREGMVVVFFGSNAGLLTARNGAIVAVRFERIDQGSVSAAGEAYDRFGAALTTGDYDGDGYSDLAVGVPSEDHAGVRDNGLVVVLFGSRYGLIRTTRWFSGAVRYERVDQGHAGAREETGDGFGTALASGDFNRDGRDDLAVGLPNENVNATDDGLVIVYYGSTAGLLVTRSGRTEASAYARITQANAGGSNETRDRFGSALAAGDFDGDGASDLAIGTPGEDAFGVSDTGMVVLFYGHARGITASGRTRRIGQSIRGADELGDQLGKRLATGDFDGDGRDEVMMGVPNENHLSVTDSGAVYPF